MEADFWHRKWESNQLGFHQKEENPLLVKYFSALQLDEHGKVFVPLCGKTLDIHWLLSHGKRVVGAELSELAVKQLFADLSIVPTVEMAGELIHYHAENIDIFVGDIFQLTAELLGPVDAIYDRAALVALPEPMREKYSQHLMAITHSAEQLIICYQYDQNLLSGPPFSITDKELTAHYAPQYSLTLLEEADVEGGFKGQYPAIEKVWFLQS